MSYDPLSQLMTNENPYGTVPPDTIAAAVKAVADQLAALRDGSNPNPTLVDGPAAAYGANMPVPPGTPTYDQLMKGLFWYFKGKPVRISKAMRLEYTLPNSPTKYSILIGFEGSGGGM